MAVIITNFASQKSLSGIWEISESECALRNLCSLTDYDKNLLENIGSELRRKEILAVRALIKHLNPKIHIKYQNRKPVCNIGNISISHSDTLAAIVWHPTKKTTVDIEQINDRIHRIAHKAFSQDEIGFANNITERLTKLWSCKECVYKLADIQGVDFIKQIFVSEFKQNTDIKCQLKTSSKLIEYNFKQMNIKNHVLVWGIV